MSALCPFCDRKFTTHQGLSSHYKIHGDLPLSEWLEHGPARSKKKLAHFKAEKEAAVRQITDETEPVLFPEPLRAVRWVQSDFYIDLPWLLQNPGAGSSREKPPGPAFPIRPVAWLQLFKESQEKEKRDKDSKKISYPLSFDLNLPPTC